MSEYRFLLHTDQHERLASASVLVRELEYRRRVPAPPCSERMIGFFTRVGRALTLLSSTAGCKDRSIDRLYVSMVHPKAVGLDSIASFTRLADFEDRECKGAELAKYR
jgi:hypothetical protein